ncbi:MAG: DUF2851 family protein [Candidatus Marinimicrobia bacterium]|mgnify:CR=1 FL=1|nr:DUF2851 family protein [Candidatus Neomarinimicrobiota bacterium]MBT5404895.1 DUF2851 family protein [Candidatus Neomarinimicrobiota bacterium]MBT6159517.1 DUF2851 family protein [Candidatus Neomarinimicrobiota bacterium]MBT6737410.1 DUF2851 family protein [Candidatus Neomarinimicrobiota bacterium]MBT7184271.1 DUF2851 family protein [Candidatus Neomarinimicrobiota bacterium]
MGSKTQVIYLQPKYQSFCVHDSPLIYEKQIVKLWTKLPKGQIFYDRNKHPIMVIDPGKENHHDGPDFLNAIVFVNGHIQRGDIEIHLHEKSWWYHGHHQNPKYQSVILHVVHQFAPSPVTFIPTILFEKGDTKGEGSSCLLAGKLIRDDIRSQLLFLSQKRWLKKVERYQMAGKDPKKLLITQSLQIVAAKGNESSMALLAEKVYCQGEHIGNKEKLIAQFLAFSQACDWNHCAVRPAKQASQLLPKAALFYHFLMKHYDMFLSEDVSIAWVQKKMRVCGFGQGLITEWLGNVFLPFLAAQSLRKGDGLGLQLWQSEWLGLRLPYTYGKAQRKFGHVLSQKELKSFSILQGFLVLESSYCEKNLCLACPGIEMNLYQ